MITTTWFIILLILVLLTWGIIDFNLGLKRQKQTGKKTIQQTRYGDVTFLTKGEDLFTAMFNDFQSAKHHIHVLFYIIRDDQISNKMFDILKQKAKEGIHVRLLIDRLGSKVKRKTIRELKETGVHFAYSHPIKWPYIFFSMNRRNHRKLTMVDGKVGYIGGYNVGDEYLGRDPKYGNWRDFHLRISGDGVQDLQEQFIEDWKVATKEEMDRSKLYPSLQQGPTPLRIMPTDGVFLEETFIDLIRQAHYSITIGTPYFIPGRGIHKELVEASKRGVDVRLIIPKNQDYPLLQEAAFPYFSSLLKSGCRVFLYKNGFYHAKAMVIDKQVCDIGTANFDKRSLNIDHEINCLIYEPTFIKLVLYEMNNDLANSEELTLRKYNQRSYFQRGKEQVATLLSPLL